MLENIINEKPEGFSLEAAVRSNRHWLVCRSCRKKHEFYSNNSAHLKHEFDDFEEKHPRWRGCYVYLMTPERVEQVCRREETKRRRAHKSVANYLHNNDIKAAFGAAVSLDLTSFNSLASSATAGWCSQAIDNSATLYVDILAAIGLAAVNTAPGSDKCFYLYGATAKDATDLPTTGAASGNIVPSSTTTAAALTFPSVSTLPCLLPLVQIVPYPVQNIANQSPMFAIARQFGGLIGKFIWLPMVNFSGMTIAASGNTYKYHGAYFTV